MVMTEKRYGKKVDDVDDTIIDITEDGNDFAWFLNDDITDKQVDKVVQRLNELTDEIEQLKQENRQLSLISEKQAKFIQSKGYDIQELIDYCRDGSND